MTDRFNANEPGISAEEKSKRLFLGRLTDWSEPGAVTVIRDGKVLDPLQVEADRPANERIAGVDADGNVILSDGTMLIP